MVLSSKALVFLNGCYGSMPEITLEWISLNGEWDLRLGFSVSQEHLSLTQRCSSFPMAHLKSYAWRTSHGSPSYHRELQLLFLLIYPIFFFLQHPKQTDQVETTVSKQRSVTTILLHCTFSKSPRSCLIPSGPWNEAQWPATLRCPLLLYWLQPYL